MKNRVIGKAEYRGYKIHIIMLGPKRVRAKIYKEGLLFDRTVDSRVTLLGRKTVADLKENGTLERFIDRQIRMCKKRIDEYENVPKVTSHA